MLCVKRLLVLLALTMLCLTGSALAATVTPTSGTVIAAGDWAGNGHTYALVEVTAGIDWSSAATAAAGASWDGGAGAFFSLATLTSQQEHDFVLALLMTGLADGAQRVAWIGGQQANNSATPSDGWSWVTGEAWSFTSWMGSEPNDFPGTGVEDNEENFLLLKSLGQDSGWNDASGQRTFYIIEVDPSGGPQSEPLPTPEPTSLLLLGSGLLGLGVLRKSS